MNKNLTYFTINNIKINNIDKNRNIIDYLENLNVKIPHYCYHPKLSVSGNCRMCLVELKNSPKPLVSCAMNVTNKMEIFTDSPLVKKARENVLEFLLLNHPLDCPICDQGGECDLQDQSMVFGTHKKRFFNYKRSVVNKNLGPIVKTVMTRCIHCTRCVRFSSEIAGVNDLGMFGRGYNSEIGTYVNKFFNSELAGNLIDVCPVGALTNKPYAFVDRSWELTNIRSLDFTTSFGSEINFSIKSNSTITKIQPFSNKWDVTTTWISDKTRFSFDSLFSPEKTVNIKMTNYPFKNFKNSWEFVLIEILNSIYFKNHLKNHQVFNHNLTFLIGESLSFEVLNILTLLQIKYSFINIYSISKNKINLDLEYNINTKMTTHENVANFNKSTLCFLIGLNTRFESSNLNLKLRNKYLQGNFKIYTLSSLLDLTYPIKSLGFNINVLKNISEGNHIMCKEIINSKNPIFIYNSKLFKKPVFNDFFNNIFQNLNEKLITFNFLNSSLTESGVNYIGSFKKFTNVAFLNSNILYCLNVELNKNELKKLTFLKLLNYLSHFASKTSYLVQQSSIKENTLLNAHFKNIVYLPNASFLEESGHFMNTEGFIIKSVKIIPPFKTQKNNWELIRKIFSLLNQNFQLKNNLPLTLDLKKKVLFLKFINLQYFAIQNFKNINSHFIFKKSNFFINLNKNKNLFKNQNQKSNVLFWFNDFYIGNFNCYSKYSKVMVECSKKTRVANTNFKIIL